MQNNVVSNKAMLYQTCKIFMYLCFPNKQAGSVIIMYEYLKHVIIAGSHVTDTLQANMRVASNLRTELDPNTV